MAKKLRTPPAHIGRVYYSFPIWIRASDMVLVDSNVSTENFTKCSFSHKQDSGQSTLVLV